MNYFQKELEERKQQHLFRSLPKVDEGIDFFSNDYLGLARSRAFANLIAQKNEWVQNGATGSRLLSGNSALFEEVESKIANFHQGESALIYSSGYAANLGLISSLSKKGVTFLMDELLHASLIDGARLGHATRVKFKHNAPDDLEQKLTRTSGEKIVIIESVYSMDGDIAPIEQITKLCEEYDAHLIIDEAHGIGVFGENGLGLTQRIISDKLLARIITYGKAPGIHGATVVSTKWLKEYQVNFSRPFIFSTAPPPHQLACILAFYEWTGKLDDDRKALNSNIQYFMEKRDGHSKKWLSSKTQIQSLIIPGNEEVIHAAERLKQAHINALPIRKPSVPAGKERIRFCIHSYNTKTEIDQLFRHI